MKTRYWVLLIAFAVIVVALLLFKQKSYWGL